MKILKNFLITPMLMIASFSRISMAENEIYNEINIKRETEINKEHENKFNINVSTVPEIIRGENFFSKISIISNEDLTLNNLHIEVTFDSDIFKFVKKNSLFSNLFKIKSYKTDDKNKKICFDLKSKDQIKLIKDTEFELLNINFKSKRKSNQKESSIEFKINTNNFNFYETISKQILILENIIEIKDIKIKNSENLKLKFDKNTKEYSLLVPENYTCVDIEIVKLVNGKETIENLHKDLNKTKNTTKIKIGEYKIEFHKEKPKKKIKMQKKFLKKLKPKKQKKTQKIINQNKKVEKLDQKIKKIESDNTNNLNNSINKLEKHDDKITQTKLSSESFSENKSESNLKKIIIACSLTSFLTVLILFAIKRNKFKKN